jgi:glycosyltransferase involved in cell wall biosynthesis
MTIHSPAYKRNFRISIIQNLKTKGDNNTQLMPTQQSFDGKILSFAFPLCLIEVIVRMKVLFILPYPLDRAPSQRFRVEKLLPLLGDAGIGYTLRPFMTEATWNILYRGGSRVQKVAGIVKGYAQRAYTVLFEASGYDKVFIHREAAPLGPPVFEWYLAKILRKPIIYDFDDAIWIPNTSAQNRLAGFFKAFWKVAFICRWSTAISAGNKYLAEFAKNKSAAKITIMPTVVDTVNQYNSIKQQRSGKVTVGWTGSHSTLKYLDLIIPVLQRLQMEFDFTFLVIADKNPDLPLTNVLYLPWNAATEIIDLVKIDIGVMPLTEDLWAEGKCGFKLIQYLASGIPAVAQPVGVNKEIIEHGINGFICSAPDEWYSNLKKLIEDIELRKTLGEQGRLKIVKEYSITANADKFLDLFN